jgi:hypothetical protein
MDAINYIPKRILLVFFIIFILVNPDIPDDISSYIRNPYGMVIISLMALSLFFTQDYILAIFGCIAAYLIIVKSGEYYQIQKYASSEAEKTIMYDKYNTISLTLEEEIVSSVPSSTSKPTTTQKFKPSMDSIHGAELFSL